MPLVPSTVMIWPVWMRVVPSTDPTTAGMANSRATIAQWLITLGRQPLADYQGEPAEQHDAELVDVEGRGACILSNAQKPSISSGPGKVTWSTVSVITTPVMEAVRLPGAPPLNEIRSAPELPSGNTGTLSEGRKLWPHDSRVHFGGVARPR